MLWTAAAGLALAGCAKKPPILPEDPVDRAATCGVVTAALERAKIGVKGDLPAEAQERIFHHALLAGAQGPSFDAGTANAVFKRMPQLFDKTIKGKWQVLGPACAAAYPETQIKTPRLPDGKLDALLDCYVLTDFLRKAFQSQGASYADAALKLGTFNTKLDGKVSPVLAAAGIKNGTPLQAKRETALSAVAKLGQPSAVVTACEAKYG